MKNGTAGKKKEFGDATGVVRNRTIPTVGFRINDSKWRMFASEVKD